MNSARPCSTTTVPLRPGGGAQRAKRRFTPSEVLIAPVTTSSGTGLAGMETSFMKQEGERCGPSAYSRVAGVLNAAATCNEKPFNFSHFLNGTRQTCDAGKRHHIKGAQALWLRTVRSGHSADHRMSLNNGGYAMRTFDLAPLYRSTVGFDRLFSMLDGFESAPGYPPYNIERTGENDYRVTVAVAGFGEKELSIEAKENTLTIKGNK